MVSNSSCSDDEGARGLDLPSATAATASDVLTRLPSATAATASDVLTRRTALHQIVVDDDAAEHMPQRIQREIIVDRSSVLPEARLGQYVE